MSCSKSDQANPGLIKVNFDSSSITNQKKTLQKDSCLLVFT